MDNDLLPPTDLKPSNVEWFIELARTLVADSALDEDKKALALLELNSLIRAIYPSAVVSKELRIRSVAQLSLAQNDEVELAFKENITSIEGAISTSIAAGIFKLIDYCIEKNMSQ